MKEGEPFVLFEFSDPKTGRYSHAELKLVRAGALDEILPEIPSTAERHDPAATIAEEKSA